MASDVEAGATAVLARKIDIEIVVKRTLSVESIARVLCAGFANSSISKLEIGLHGAMATI